MASMVSMMEKPGERFDMKALGFDHKAKAKVIAI